MCLPQVHQLLLCVVRIAEGQPLSAVCGERQTFENEKYISLCYHFICIEVIAQESYLHLLLHSPHK